MARRAPLGIGKYQMERSYLRAGGATRVDMSGAAAPCRSHPEVRVRFFLVPRSRRTRLTVLSLTPWRLANSTSVEPAEYEAATVLGSSFARPVGCWGLAPGVVATEALVSCLGCARTSANVLTSAFAWSAWFE